MRWAGWRCSVGAVARPACRETSVPAVARRLPVSLAVWNVHVSAHASPAVDGASSVPDDRELDDVRQMTAGSPVAGDPTSEAAGAAPGHRAARLVRDAGELRDGTPVRVRPLVAHDRALLLAGFRDLSPRSRRDRFLRDVSEAQFARMLPILLDTVDQRAHVALVLYAAGRPIALGRLQRFLDDPGAADLAVTVADDWQGRGAGSALARELIARAGDLREIRTVVSADNTASLRMLARLGELHTDCANGDCDVVVQLGRSPAAARADAA